MSWLVSIFRRFFGGLTIFLGPIRDWWGGIVDLLNFSDHMKSLIAAWKSRSQKDIGIEGQGISSGPVLPEVGTKAPQLDRQPINQAYEYLVGLRVVQQDGEDGKEPMQIAGLLRQAALDRQIMIWGSEPSSAPVESQAPILLEINRGYWEHHGIDPVSLMSGASELPEKGCKTQRGSDPFNDQTECYWHLHVDMKQVKSKWFVFRRR